MKKPTPNLTHLLNKAEALLAAGIGTEKELVAFLQCHQPQANDWLKRRSNPSGEVTLQIATWVALKESEIEASAADGGKIKRAFHREFARIEKEHPSEK